ncbi:MAG: 50S ribosomal protein L35 [Alphaproteobacteria bacterium]|nr:50S ribosomal protein L35 [Alphaproteobacteria bacterium]
MPKMKTKSAAKKRFKVTGTGKVKAEPANCRHLMLNKSASANRKKRSMTVMFKADEEKVLKNWLPHNTKGKKRNAKARKALAFALKKAAAETKAQKGAA